MHGVEAKGVDCPAIDGIIEEASEIAGDVDDKTVLDAALIAAAQAVEHYEITRYGTLIAWAKQLGRNDCASVLQQNLDEEKATDKQAEYDGSAQREPQSRVSLLGKKGLPVPIRQPFSCAQRKWNWQRSELGGRCNDPRGRIGGGELERPRYNFGICDLYRCFDRLDDRRMAGEQEFASHPERRASVHQRAWHLALAAESRT